MSVKDDLADTIGLTGYAIDSSGIGGILKSRVADFRVDEISTKISLDPRGRFTAANITLTNWETNRFIGKLAKACGISRNRIFFAGTKDKRAITRQVFIIDAPANKVAKVDIPDVEIEILGRTHQKIGFGNHRGNRFTIVTRGCCHPDGSPMTDAEAMEKISEIEKMMKEKLGRIVNISSVVASSGNPGQANYCASKGGLEAMTRSVALELATRGITANSIAPGFIETSMTEKLNEKQREAMLSKIPMARVGKPAEIADAVNFLLSDGAAYITGQTLHINGGLYLS